MSGGPRLGQLGESSVTGTDNTEWRLTSLSTPLNLCVVEALITRLTAPLSNRVLLSKFWVRSRQSGSESYA